MSLHSLSLIVGADLTYVDSSRLLAVVISRKVHHAEEGVKTKKAEQLLYKSIFLSSFL